MARRTIAKYRQETENRKLPQYGTYLVMVFRDESQRSKAGMARTRHSGQKFALNAKATSPDLKREEKGAWLKTRNWAPRVNERMPMSEELMARWGFLSFVEEVSGLCAVSMVSSGTAGSEGGDFGKLGGKAIFRSGVLPSKRGLENRGLLRPFFSQVGAQKGQTMTSRSTSPSQ